MRRKGSTGPDWESSLGRGQEAETHAHEALVIGGNVLEAVRAEEIPGGGAAVAGSVWRGLAIRGGELHSWRRAAPQKLDCAVRADCRAATAIQFDVLSSCRACALSEWLPVDINIPAKSAFERSLV
jgi:hypothetical protein